MLLFNHALSEEGGKEKIFLFLSTITHFCIKRVETALPHPLQAKSLWLRFTKVVDFDFKLPCFVFSPCLLPLIQ